MNIMLQKLRARDLTHVINNKTKDQLLIAFLNPLLKVSIARQMSVLSTFFKLKYLCLVFSEVVA
jgi:hypothetical protein